MAGQANDEDKLPWLEPYREPGAAPARRGRAKLEAVAPSAPAAPAKPATARRGVPLAGWLATGAAVVALAAGGGYWIGNRNNPAPPAAAPTVTIPVAKVDPIPMPDVEETAAEAPVSSSSANAPRTVHRARAPHRTTRHVVRRAPTRAAPSRPDAAPPMPKVMSVNFIRQGSAGPPGTVVDLGRYLSPNLADSAFRVTATRYPYLGKLQRVVVPLPPVYGQPRLYALQVGAKSAREAKQLCENLIKIGRPCDVR